MDWHPSLELVVLRQLLPANAAQHKVGVLARRNLQAGLEPDHGESGTGPKALAVSSGYSREGATRWTGVEGNARSACHWRPLTFMSLMGLHG